MSTEGRAPVRRPAPLEEPVHVVNPEGLSIREQRLCDHAIELILDMRRSVQATFESHTTVLALAGRNAAVTIDNVMGGQFRDLQPQVAMGEEFNFEREHLLPILEGVDTIIDMMAHQMQLRPHLEATKVEVPHHNIIINEYRKLLENLFQIREARLRLGTHRIDVVLQIMQQLYAFWDTVHPLLTERAKKV